VNVWIFTYPEIMSMSNKHSVVSVEAETFSEALVIAKEKTHNTSVLDGASCSLTFEKWLDTRVMSIMKVRVE